MSLKQRKHIEQSCAKKHFAIEIVKVMLITDIIRWEETGKNPDLRRALEQHLTL